MNWTSGMIWENLVWFSGNNVQILKLSNDFNVYMNKIPDFPCDLRLLFPTLWNSIRLLFFFLSYIAQPYSIFEESWKNIFYLVLLLSHQKDSRRWFLHFSSASFSSWMSDCTQCEKLAVKAAAHFWTQNITTIIWLCWNLDTVIEDLSHWTLNMEDGWSTKRLPLNFPRPGLASNECGTVNLHLAVAL